MKPRSLPRTVFSHLFVPLDLSRKSERALTTALAIATQNHARVTLVHVIHRIEHVPMAELRDFYDRLEVTAQRAMARAARPFTAAKLPLRTLVLIGDPAREIVRWAAANGVDLIVLGSHRIDPTQPAARWGTTSYKVGVLCQCPVLLVK